MENWNYKGILTKINKIEKSIKRLEMGGFKIDRDKLKDIIITNKIYCKDINLDYLKVHNELNDMLNHLHKLEKIDEYYTLIKFKINNDKNIKLFLDAYVNDTLDIIKPLNAEIKEYGYGNLGKFIGKFYNLVYFLIKLEIGVNGESEIGRELFNHSGHAYYLRELAISELNRAKMNNDERQNLKNKIKGKTYDSFAGVILRLIKNDRKMRKILNLTDDNLNLLGNKENISDQEVLLEIKKLIKKKD